TGRIDDEYLAVGNRRRLCHVCVEDFHGPDAPDHRLFSAPMVDPDRDLVRHPLFRAGAACTCTSAAYGLGKVLDLADQAILHSRHLDVDAARSSRSSAWSNLC